MGGDQRKTNFSACFGVYFFAEIPGTAHLYARICIKNTMTFPAFINTPWKRGQLIGARLRQLVRQRVKASFSLSPPLSEKFLIGALLKKKNIRSLKISQVLLRGIQVQLFAEPPSMVMTMMINYSLKQHKFIRNGIIFYIVCWQSFLHIRRLNKLLRKVFLFLAFFLKLNLFLVMSNLCMKQLINYSEIFGENTNKIRE